jgi:hypothetical protein
MAKKYNKRKKPMRNPRKEGEHKGKGGGKGRRRKRECWS